MMLPFVLPFLFLILVAIEPQQQFVRGAIGIPSSVTGTFLRQAWDSADLGGSIVNSLIAVSVSVFITISASALCAYWVLRHPGRIGRAVLGLLVAAWMVPYVIYLVPLFVILAQFGLTDNLFTLSFIYAATNIPFALYLLYTYFKHGIPGEVRDAARVDGVTAAQELFRIILPLAKPVLVTAGALSFIWAWGDLLLAAIFLQNPARLTVTLAASTLVQRENPNVQLTAAAAVISILPLFVVFIFSQRALVRGLTAGVGR